MLTITPCKGNIQMRQCNSEPLGYTEAKYLLLKNGSAGVSYRHRLEGDMNTNPTRSRLQRKCYLVGLDSKVTFCNLVTNGSQNNGEFHQQLNTHKIFWKYDIPEVIKKRHLCSQVSILWNMGWCPFYTANMKDFTADILWVNLRF